ncbi:RNA 2',3'-cyclic phosphodiesterase [Bdellovibrio sp. qaytius]|nr:RNA 2',3'-cyclic phosphodiesterase [Bdellovibrio sp. qaytius]
MSEAVKTKRLFVAIKPSLGQIYQLDPYLKKLKKSFDQKEIQIKWSPLENMHITLNFLGEISEEKIPVLRDKISEVANQFNDFNLKIHDLGAFDHFQKARTVFVDVQRSQSLLDLQSLIEQKLELIPQQQYYPHLTLGRLRNPNSIESAISPFKKIDLGKGEISSLFLMQSQLSGHFPIYSDIFEAPLVKNPA